MSELAAHWLGHAGPSIKDLIGTGKAQKTFAEVEIADATKYAAEDADLTFRLWHILKPRLVAENATTLYETIERPLAPVLARMEARGITVDRNILSRLSGDFAQRAAAFEAEAYELAGSNFNLGSPKQLGEILFDRMKLEGGTKTKTGAWATGADVLEDLAAKGIPLARTIVDWRQLTKLMGTYTNALPGYINRAPAASTRATASPPSSPAASPRTIRTSRTSPSAPRTAEKSAPPSSRPRQEADLGRLQPDRAPRPRPYRRYPGAQGRLRGGPRHPRHDRVRNVRRPGRGHAIRRAPPRQGDQFRHHLRHLRLRPRQPARHRARVAGDYIKTYFERFPGIKDYMDEQRRRVKIDGYVTTLFGRKINFPNANSANAAERSFVERASINAPIQGTAADIIRRAMIRMEPAAESRGHRGRHAAPGP